MKKIGENYYKKYLQYLNNTQNFLKKIFLKKSNKFLLILIKIEKKTILKRTRKLYALITNVFIFRN